MSYFTATLGEIVIMAAGLALIIFSGPLSRAGRPSYRYYQTPQAESLVSLVYLFAGIVAVVIGVLILLGRTPFQWGA